MRRRSMTMVQVVYMRRWCHWHGMACVAMSLRCILCCFLADIPSPSLPFLLCLFVCLHQSPSAPFVRGALFLLCVLLSCEHITELFPWEQRGEGWRKQMGKKRVEKGKWSVENHRITTNSKHKKAYVEESWRTMHCTYRVGTKRKGGEKEGDGKGGWSVSPCLAPPHPLLPCLLSFPPIRDCGFSHWFSDGRVLSHYRNSVVHVLYRGEK
jgi:hypothetical protein